LFPEATVSMSGAGQPVILGISTSVWQVVHDWSGVVMAAGVGVHTALHFKWLVAMTGKMVRGKRPAGQTQASPRAGKQAPTPAAQPVAIQATRVAAPQADTTVALARLQSMGRGQDESRGSQRRYTRKSFLAAAGIVGAAALVTGWSLLGRDDESVASAVSTESTDATATSGNGHRNTTDEYEAGASASESTSTDSAAGGAATTSTSNARVVIDADACTGCGNCLQTCPYGVFTMSGGKAVVQNADACRLCGRCTGSCAPGAITLNP
ncbi:MAG TPA: 4Fe-4S dicluster domain-containing protein, partial [Thermoleophilia bacterium]|nr:4Fe-4S dicluster domain-containing protein [Thermoleophilia bacterium]